MVDFTSFNTTDAAYSTTPDGKEIELSILTPKDLQPGTYPVIVRFHGGFLGTGSRMYPEWFPEWILELALRQPAILISADYRLMPESSGSEILSDVSALFTWLHDSFPFTLSTLGIAADLSSILVVGESAGGYLAVQSALLHPKAGIKAVVSAYGVLDIKTRFFLEAFEKIIVGSEMVDPAILDEHLKKIRSGDSDMPKTVTAADPPLRMDITLAMVQQGRFVEFLGEDSKLFPMDNLETRAKDGEDAPPVPPMWLFHTRDDTAVPVASSQAFAEKLKTLHPNTDLLLTIEEGEHGFDRFVPFDTPWMQKGVEFLGKHWP